MFPSGRKLNMNYILNTQREGFAPHVQCANYTTPSRAILSGWKLEANIKAHN